MQPMDLPHHLPLPPRQKGLLLPALLCMCLGLLLVWNARVYVARSVPEWVCPNEQTFLLADHSPALTAVLVRWSGTLVGGDTSDAAGSWHLAPHIAAPGIYLVEVRVRVTQTLLGQLPCLVDLPLSASATGIAWLQNLSLPHPPHHQSRQRRAIHRRRARQQRHHRYPPRPPFQSRRPVWPRSTS